MLQTRSTAHIWAVVVMGTIKALGSLSSDTRQKIFR